MANRQARSARSAKKAERPPVAGAAQESLRMATTATAPALDLTAVAPFLEMLRPHAAAMGKSLEDAIIEMIAFYLEEIAAISAAECRRRGIHS